MTKRFGGIVALEDVSVDVDRGEAVGLIGPNGAGKTTLFDCLNGVRRFDGGEVRFEGRASTGCPIYERARLGIGRTFQRLELFAGMSTREHLMVAERVHRGDGAALEGPDRPRPGRRARSRASRTSSPSSASRTSPTTRSSR